jgi:glycosyltransferase involved in cell wall biosynthesis
MVGPFGFHPKKTMRSRALSLARPLVRRGHQVRMIMPPMEIPEEAGKVWEEDGVELRYTRLDGGIAATTWRLIRETLAWRPEVVHCFKPKSYSGLVMWWFWQIHRHRLRLVTDTDDWEGWGGWNDLAFYTPLQKWFFAWQEQWGLRHCHALTVASRTLQSLAWSLGVPPQRTVYIPNGPGIRVQNPPAHDPATADLGERPTVLLYSRLFEFDVERLVRILQEVRIAVPDMAVLAVGTGLYEENAAQLRRSFSAAGLNEVVVDVGWIEEGRLPGILDAADVGIHLMEDTLLNRTKCPVKLADMLCMGVPVVAEAVGQVNEYVLHDRTGLLYANGDAEGLTAGLVHLLQDEVDRERLAEEAKLHIAENFSWERLSQAVERAYRGSGP